MLAPNLASLQGEAVKSAPRGFAKDHRAIDLIRKMQFYFLKGFTDDEVKQSDFLGNVVHAFQAIGSYFDYMSEALTTNLDGARPLSSRKHNI